MNVVIHIFEKMRRIIWKISNLLNSKKKKHSGITDRVRMQFLCNEEALEYSKPAYMSLIDLQKAFDRIKGWRLSLSTQKNTNSCSAYTN